jgi:uncharacterized protein YydD (DUF2326 family)
MEIRISPLVEKFMTAGDNSIAYFQEELRKTEQLHRFVAIQMEEVIALAEMIYTEGDDYYGAGYISQHLPDEQRVMLQEILDENLPFDLMSTELSRISATLSRFKENLKEELPY